jgi:hypothetical protein
LRYAARAGRDRTDGAAGDEVFDRKTIAACRARGHRVDLFHPVPVGKLREAINLLAGVSHYRARFASRSNRAAIRRMAAGYDATICSWEPLDALACGLRPPGLMILHNVTSQSLPALFPQSRLAALGAARARAWERRCYRPAGFSTIAALSKADLAYLAALPDHPPLLLLPPGMPPCVALAEGAVLVPEIVISGTYDWTPKRRDALAFAGEYAAVENRLTVRADGLPEAASRQLRPAPLPSAEACGAALRFGLITDRFVAGHKLKTLAYIADNQIVLSFADVAGDIAHVPDHDFFIRRIGSVGEIASHAAELAAVPAAELRARFLDFQARCAGLFTWDAVAADLLAAAGAAV